MKSAKGVWTVVVGSVLLALATTLTPHAAAAQDPAKVDAKHYKVVYEDAGIRVLHLTFGPHEKSVMHAHPLGTCAIFITPFQGKDTDDKGKVTTNTGKPGDVTCTP